MWKSLIEVITIHRLLNKCYVGQFLISKLKAPTVAKSYYEISKIISFFNKR